MNKRLALVPLIQASFLLSPDVKIALLKRLGEFGEEDVVTLGEYLAAERDFVVANSQKIQDYANTLIDYFGKSEEKNPDMVYVGSGNPS